MVKLKLIPYHADCTIVESYFSALKKLNLKFETKNIEEGKGDALEFYFSKEMEENLVQKYSLDKKDYIVLAPGASKFTKKWPYYNELSKKILEKTNFRIFVIGGKEDFESVENNNERVINLCGKISFKESGIILKYSKLSVVNDSGPFHISRAVGAKTFVFFGPTDPKLFSFEENTYLFQNPNCPPHSLYGDDKFQKKYSRCMSDIKLEDVFKKIISEI